MHEIDTNTSDEIITENSSADNEGLHASLNRTKSSKSMDDMEQVEMTNMYTNTNNMNPHRIKSNMRQRHRRSVPDLLDGTAT